MGAIEFGEAEVYKYFEVRLAKARGLTDRCFKIELGNKEDREVYSMKRQFETTVNIKAIDFNFDDDSDDSDFGEFFEDSYDSATALEQVNRSISSKN